MLFYVCNPGAFFLNWLYDIFWPPPSIVPTILPNYIDYLKQPNKTIPQLIQEQFKNVKMNFENWLD